MTAGLATARLIRLELRHNAMLWLLPAVIAIFWFATYRKTMALPPLWSPRVTTLQTGAVADFIIPVVGAATWIGSREARRRTREVVAITAWSRWSRLLVIWAALTGWALAGYLACITPVYWITAHQVHWGGPLWWPAVVAAAAVPMLTALGFAIGTLIPGRFTAPATAILAFFALALSTELVRTPSYWQISPLVSGPWETGPDAGVATFFAYQPDLPIAQVIFLAGLTTAILAGLILATGAAESAGRRLCVTAVATATFGLLTAGTGVALAGTGKLDAQGMIDIPALHNAAAGRPLSFAPVCSRGRIPVCLNPAYASLLPAVTTALQPVLGEVAGLPGAPGRIIQAAATYQQGSGNAGVGLRGPVVAGSAYRVLLPDQLLGPALTTSQFEAQTAESSGADILAAVVGDSPAASAAQHAVWASLMLAAGLPVTVQPDGGASQSRSVRLLCEPSQSGCQAVAQDVLDGPIREPELTAGSAALAAARRFAALPAPARHHWLAAHLTALRAGQLTLDQLP